MKIEPKIKKISAESSFYQKNRGQNSVLIDSEKVNGGNSEKKIQVILEQVLGFLLKYHLCNLIIIFVLF